jgi:hypothetical protein
MKSQQSIVISSANFSRNQSPAKLMLHQNPLHTDKKKEKRRRRGEAESHRNIEIVCSTFETRDLTRNSNNLLESIIDQKISFENLQIDSLSDFEDFCVSSGFLWQFQSREGRASHVRANVATTINKSQCGGRRLSRQSGSFGPENESKALGSRNQS